jgi:hypothetical protein
MERVGIHIFGVDQVRIRFESGTDGSFVSFVVGANCSIGADLSLNVPHAITSACVVNCLHLLLFKTLASTCLNIMIQFHVNDLLFFF